MLPLPFFHFAFLCGLILASTIRIPIEIRRKRAAPLDARSKVRITGSELVVLLSGFVGMVVVPLVYVFTDWLSFADYDLPSAFGWIGIAIGTVGLVLLGVAHRQLGPNFSPQLELMDDHILVNDGIYGVIRHPIYTAHLLGAIAQFLLLHNALAGSSFLIAMLVLIVLRVPGEEKMMLERFGESYRNYSETTNRYFPSFRKLR